MKRSEWQIPAVGHPEPVLATRLSHPATSRNTTCRTSMADIDISAAWQMRYRYEQIRPSHPDGPLAVVINDEGRMRESTPGRGIGRVGELGFSFGLARSYADFLHLAAYAASEPNWSGVWAPMLLSRPELEVHLGNRAAVRKAVASSRFGTTAQAAAVLREMESKS